MLKLINKWLKVSVYENGQYKSGKDNHTGTPQGGVISPLLANIYLHLVDRIVNNAQSLFSKHGVKMVRYADDFVLMGRTLPEEAIKKLKNLLHRMGLSLNEDKTRQLDAKTESFSFLGFTIRYDKDINGRNIRYWNIVPSKKSEQKIRDKVKEYLKTHGHYKAKDVADGLNSILRGWLNYFSIFRVSYPAMSKRRLREYLSLSLYRYYNRKSQRKSRLFGHDAFKILSARYGLIDPSKHVTSSARL
jgi:RNA-directed DNA polymerase